MCVFVGIWICVFKYACVYVFTQHEHNTTKCQHVGNWASPTKLDELAVFGSIWKHDINPSGDKPYELMILYRANSHQLSSNGQPWNDKPVGLVWWLSRRRNLSWSEHAELTWEFFKKSSFDKRASHTISIRIELNQTQVDKRYEGLGHPGRTSSWCKRHMFGVKVCGKHTIGLNTAAFCTPC